ncbi:ADP-ribosylation factor-binding protein GGA3 isoform X3 [Astatotilapia calliptera]|uniref:ADP-ribosylation factor-binding protein GGA3 isoform X1 n=2 Tax=Haplochromini TaxID=319058 RepID=UPI0006467FCE|nr:ADP-ribosylation factor-binding protein GGA3 isoform X1 [Maylandia zebra]XP_026020925.1 ADP-ribosylation factor-binding protein GGA3 isoform X3 [Astatotilapia calliptera]
MAYQEGESLESWLNKATHPTNRQEDWEYIIGFCDQINKELEGPQIAVTLLVHKIHSPQEWEALQALTVLEACMKNCGRRFHNEVGKYRFLNELIKVVSPKYMGDSAPEKVKLKIVEMLYSWTVAFPSETKIGEAYQTLKRQGLVAHDPELPLDRTLIPSPPTRPKHPVFDNEDMGKLLAELLRSKNPEDLQEANRLIKNMVKEDEARVQKVTKRIHTLEEVNINVKLLTEMLSHYNKDSSTDSDKEIIKELYERCDKLRRAAFKMATETEDNDTSLGDILQASDDLSRVINAYKKIVEGQPINGDSEEPLSTAGHSESAETTDTLIDLAGLDVPSPPQPAAPPPQPSHPVAADLTVIPIPVLPPPPKRLAGSQGSSPSHPPASKASTALSLLDDELLSLGLNDPPTSQSSQSKPKLDEISNQWSSLQAPATSVGMFGSIACSGPVVPPAEPAVTHSLQNLQDLAMMGFSDHKSLSNQTTARGTSFGVPAAAPPLVPVQGSPSSAALLQGPLPGSPALSHVKAHSFDSAPGSPLFRSLSPCHPPLQGSPARANEISLSNVHVPLEAIRPSKVLPVTAYDKDGVRMLLNFASDCPPGRPDVLVMVVSMLNTAPLPVHNVVLQAAVPKSMKLKLQPPSGTELAPFNPILPPASITQIMLLANPAKDKVRLRYKLAFTLGDRPCNEVGEVDQFPPPEMWGHL